MMKNYLKIFIRNVKRQKAYSFINIAGLAVAMAGAMIILLWIRGETGYDREHRNADRIYALVTDLKIGSNQFRQYATNGVLAGVLPREFPEVEKAVRFGYEPSSVVSHGATRFNENGILYADASVFEVFSYTLVKGDPLTALQIPSTVVLSESMARKYFGAEEPLGQSIQLNNRDEYTVTGIFRDVSPRSHRRFNMLLSFETLVARSKTSSYYFGLLNNLMDNNFNTYVLLKPGVRPGDLEAKFPALIQAKAGDQLKASGAKWAISLQPLRKIYLEGLPGNGTPPILFVRLFAAIAGLIILIAGTNFVNLTTARSVKRSKEIGIRKIVGAQNNWIIRQLLLESILFTLAALMIAFGLVRLALPWVGLMIGGSLGLDGPTLLWLLPGALAGALLIGLLAGLYPAWSMTTASSTRGLKRLSSRGSGSLRFRGVLVVIQFAISIVLIIGTSVIIKQLNYLKDRDPGFNKSRVVVLRVSDKAVWNSLAAIKSELRNITGVDAVAAASTIPGWGSQSNQKLPQGYAPGDRQLMDDINVDPDFIPALGIKLTAGRNFSDRTEGDRGRSVIINETAAKRFGWKDPLGKTILTTGTTPQGQGLISRTVIGVIADVQIRDVSRPIEPLFMDSDPTRPGNPYRLLLLRLAPGPITATLQKIREKWTQLTPLGTFNYSFLDADFDAQFRSIENFQRLFSSFAVVAIFIACLGLFGLASYMAETRTKEIGIRKVLGASVPGVVFLLCREFGKWVLLANVIAWPLAYAVMGQWLRDFAYRIHPGLPLFIVSGVLTMLIALATVFSQSLKAALAEPGECLRYE